MYWSAQAPSRKPWENRYDLALVLVDLGRLAEARQQLAEVVHLAIWRRALPPRSGSRAARALEQAQDELTQAVLSRPSPPRRAISSALFSASRENSITNGFPDSDGYPVGLSPSTLSFGSLKVGASSPPQTITLTNVRNTPLQINRVFLEGSDAGSFTETNNCPSGNLAAGGTCTITVTPQATGSLSADVDVQYAATGSPGAVPLSGTGSN